MHSAGRGYDFQLRTKTPPHKDNNCLIFTHLYVFRTVKKNKYIVHVEEYMHDIYAIKFFKQSHANSKKRYLLTTREFDAKKIIMTCVNIGISILEVNTLASFVFIGSPTIPEVKREYNKFQNTKRFKVYKNFASFFFSSDSFDHLYDINKSSYFILNKKKKLAEPKIENLVYKMFNEYYVLDDLFEQMSSLV